MCEAKRSTQAIAQKVSPGISLAMYDSISIVMGADWQQNLQRRYACPWKNQDLHHLLSKHGPKRQTATGNQTPQGLVGFLFFFFS